MKVRSDLTVEKCVEVIKFTHHLGEIGIAMDIAQAVFAMDRHMAAKFISDGFVYLPTLGERSVVALRSAPQKRIGYILSTFHESHSGPAYAWVWRDDYKKPFTFPIDQLVGFGPELRVVSFAHEIVINIMRMMFAKRGIEAAAEIGHALLDYSLAYINEFIENGFSRPPKVGDLMRTRRDLRIVGTVLYIHKGNGGHETVMVSYNGGLPSLYEAVSLEHSC